MVAAGLLAAASVLSTGGQASAASAGASPGPLAAHDVGVVVGTTASSAVAVDDPARTAYVTQLGTPGGTGTLAVVDLAAGSAVASTPVGAGPRAVAVDPDRDTAVVVERPGGDGTDAAGSSVTIVDTRTRSVTAHIPVETPGQDPRYAAATAVALDPVTGLAYVSVSYATSSTEYASVLVVDPRSGSVVGRIRAGLELTAPTDIAIDAVTRTAQVLSYSEIVTIDLVSGSVVRTLDLARDLGPTGGGTSLALDPTTGTAWVGQPGTPPVFAVRRDERLVGGRLLGVDLAAGRVASVVPVGGGVADVAVDVARRTVVAANTNGTVTAVDADTGQIGGSVVTPADDAVAVDPTTGAVLAASAPTGVSIARPVGPARPTTTTLLATPGAAADGVVTALVATVTENPGGHVTFLDDGRTVAGCGYVTATAGAYLCPATFSYSGAHQVTAIYYGDDAHQASSSTTAVVVAAQADPVARAFGELLRLTYTLGGFFGIFPTYML